MPAIQLLGEHNSRTAGDRIPRSSDTRVSLAAQAEVNSRRKGFIRAQARHRHGIAASHVYDCDGAWE
jgi:hypothetical protein